MNDIKESSLKLVSIIIPTKNSIKTMSICLKSIINQTYPEIEIIVADSDSKDGTSELCEKHGARVYNRSAESERTGKKNFAAKKAKGDFVYFVDSDFQLTPRVVERCIKKCDKGFDSIIVPERVIPRNGFWETCRQLEIITYEGDDSVESPRFFRKEVFDKTGGFDESLIFGEENDLNIRVRDLGYNVGRIKEVLFHHEGPVSSVILRKFYYGKTSLLYINKKRTAALTQFSFVRQGWIKNRNYLAHKPLYAIGMVIQKFVQYLAAGLGLIVSLLENGFRQEKAK
jgi:glycosyltransferase involved in cell wall biosynthesis